MPRGRGRGRNPRRYLYYNKTIDRWYMKTSQIYIKSSKYLEELLPIWEECNEADWQLPKLREIKEKYKYGNPYGKGIIHIQRYKKDKYAVYVWREGKRKYGGVYNTREEALKVQQAIIDSNYTYDPVRHKREYRRRGGRYRYIRDNPSGTYSIVKQGEYYGTFYRLEDALEERDLLEKVNWNYDELDGL